MADLITDLVTDLNDKLQTISAIQNKVIYVYDSDDLMTEKTKTGYPCIGLVYNSMQGKVNSERKQGPQGLMATVTIDVIVLGGQQCVEKISQATGVKMKTTEFLEQIRAAIRQTTPQPGTVGADSTRRKQTRVWSFVQENPIFLDDQSIGYLQRWRTDVGLT